jgi:hypothetical protein
MISRCECTSNIKEDNENNEREKYKQKQSEKSYHRKCFNFMQME